MIHRFFAIFTIVAIASSSAIAFAQDTDFNPLGRELPLAEMEKQVRVQLEWIELSHTDFTALMEEDDLSKPVMRKSSNDGPLRKELKEMIAEDRAKIIDTLIVIARSGQRAKIESIYEYIYPTEYIEPGIIGTGGKDGAAQKISLLPTATAFETRNVGTTLEVDPVLGADDRTIDLNLAPELVYLVGQEKYGKHKAGDSEVEVVMPLIYTIKTTTQVTVIAGEYSLIGVNSPFRIDTGMPDHERKIMLFVKVDLIYVGLPLDSINDKKNSKKK